MINLIYVYVTRIWGFPGDASSKEPVCQCRRPKPRRFDLCQEEPLEEGMTTHSSILTWRIPGQRRLVGYSPWGCKELDMTEAI